MATTRDDGKKKDKKFGRDSNKININLSNKSGILPFRSPTNPLSPYFTCLFGVNFNYGDRDEEETIYFTRAIQFVFYEAAINTKDFDSAKFFSNNELGIKDILDKYNSLDLPEEWYYKGKLNSIRHSIYYKFSQDSESLNCLLSTHPKLLVYSTDTDDYSGITIGIEDDKIYDTREWGAGRNIQGKLMTLFRNMERARLKFETFGVFSKK